MSISESISTIYQRDLNANRVLLFGGSYISRSVEFKKMLFASVKSQSKCLYLNFSQASENIVFDSGLQRPVTYLKMNSFKKVKQMLTYNGQGLLVLDFSHFFSSNNGPIQTSFLNYFFKAIFQSGNFNDYDIFVDDITFDPELSIYLQEFPGTYVLSSSALSIHRDILSELDTIISLEDTFSRDVIGLYVPENSTIFPADAPPSMYLENLRRRDVFIVCNRSFIQTNRFVDRMELPLYEYYGQEFYHVNEAIFEYVERIST